MHEAVVEACDRESDVKYGILTPRKKTENDVFLDICGGPGAWSELMLRETTMAGFGITLSVSMTKNADIWYEQLYASPRWRALWGRDDDGNVYSPANLQRTRDDLRYQRVVLAVGDGGFKVGRAENGAHQVRVRACVRACVVVISNRVSLYVGVGELSRVVFSANCIVGIVVCGDDIVRGVGGGFVSFVVC